MDLSLVPVDQSQEKVYTRILRDVYGSFTERDGDHLPKIQRFIGYVDKEPAFTATAIDFNTLVRGQILKSAGVAAVATLPEFRGAKVGQRFMDMLNSSLCEMGYVMSQLYAFRDSFYRKSGYVTSGWRWKLEVDASRLAKFDLELPVHKVSSDEPWVLNDCYEQHISSRTGSAIRTEELWRQRMGTNPPQIYGLGDPIEAYFWSIPHGFYVPLEVGEFAWSSERGYRSALALMRSLAINKSKVSWIEPPDSPYLQLYYDDGVEATRYRSSMVSILDIEGCLQGLGKGHWKVQKVDDRFALNHQGDSVSADRTGLTGLIMGDPELSTLIHHGHLSGTSDSLAALAAEFPPIHSVCMEFF